MSLETLKQEIEQAEQAGTAAAIDKFFAHHPILHTFARVWVAGQWFLRACLWTLALLLVVVGLKVLWLAVLYMWRLV